MHKTENSVLSATKAGFTLVELLVVVAILGILGTIGISGVNKYIDKTTDLCFSGAISTNIKHISTHKI